MRIAQVAPLYEAVPPRLYGGTERIVAHLTDALVELGHEVTLFASADARTRAKLVPVRDQAIRLDPNPLKSDLAAHLSMLHELHRRAGEFDVLHFHVDLVHFPFFEEIAGPDRDHAARPARPEGPRRGLPALAGLPAGLHLAPTRGSRCPWANWVATVAHGVREDLYRFTAAPEGGYLAFLGRISPEKRPDRAIAIARRAGLRLKIAAKVDAADRAYFERVIEPLLADPLVEFVGEIGDAEKSGVPRRRRGAPVPDRLAGAVRPRHDRGHGLRHAGHRLAPRLRAGGRRRRRHRLRRGLGGRGGGGRASGRDARPAPRPRASSSGASPSTVMARDYVDLYRRLADDADLGAGIAAGGGAAPSTASERPPLPQ